MEKLIEKILGKEILKDFEIKNVKEIEKGRKEEFTNELIIDLREKTERIPMVNDSVKLESKGFCEPIELIDFPIGGMATYLKIYRREWRDKETKKVYRNTYEIRFPGTKITRRFGVFLKAEDRDKVYQLLSAVPYLHDKIEEDILVVQKSSLEI